MDAPAQLRHDPQAAVPPYSSLIYQTPSPVTGSPSATDPNLPNVGGKLASASNPQLALPLIPYDLTNYIAANALTGDIVHRFYHEQLQIDNGVLETKHGDLDKFVTWSDNPGLVLSYIDATNLPEGKLSVFLNDENHGSSAGFNSLIIRKIFLNRKKISSPFIP
jgi:hypothetical protein